MKFFLAFIVCSVAQVVVAERNCRADNNQVFKTVLAAMSKTGLKCQQNPQKEMCVDDQKRTCLLNMKPNLVEEVNTRTDSVLDQFENLCSQESKTYCKNCCEKMKNIINSTRTAAIDKINKLDQAQNSQVVPQLLDIYCVFGNSTFQNMRALGLPVVITMSIFGCNKQITGKYRDLFNQAVSEFSDLSQRFYTQGADCFDDQIWGCFADQGNDNIKGFNTVCGWGVTLRKNLLHISENMNNYCYNTNCNTGTTAAPASTTAAPAPTTAAPAPTTAASAPTTAAPAPTTAAPAPTTAAPALTTVASVPTTTV